ncbi:MAG: hypothetical protein ABSB32_21755 [Thermodesulfobacteriota bacterium]|jgi:hypothetical protein
MKIAEGKMPVFDGLIKIRHSRVGGNPSRRKRDTKLIEKTGFPFSRE